ncbi:MAG: NAD-dependent epimerase/dehydratase family protein [Bacteroidetes bacterium]|nr:NAD-dependent epimerase/dehydratase family protein [Bacteroidota bacterium]
MTEQGFSVNAMYHSDNTALKGLPVSLFKGNILNKEDLLRVFSSCDIVINCAAIISIHGDPDGVVFKTNTEGPANVLEMAIKSGIKKIIHLSSVHAVVEEPFSIPFDEKRTYKKATAAVYDYSKALGEQFLLNTGNTNAPEVVILRPSAVIGPFDFKPSEMGKALIQFYDEKILALPEGGYNFVDVRDVVDSVIHAIEKGRNGQIYMLSGNYYTLKQLANIIKKVTGKKVPSLIIPTSILHLLLPIISLYSKISGTPPLFTKTSIDVLKSCHPNMDHSKATSELGHAARPLEETIRDFYEWQKTNNNIQ